MRTDVGRLVRVSVTDTDQLGIGRVYFHVNAGVAREIQETDYHAFGLTIKKSLSGFENKYQYYGKAKRGKEQILYLFCWRNYTFRDALYTGICWTTPFYGFAAKYTYILRRELNEIKI